MTTLVRQNARFLSNVLVEDRQDRRRLQVVHRSGPLLSIFRDRKSQRHPSWIEQALWHEIGYLRAPRQSDGGSYLSDCIASARGDDLLVERLLFAKLQTRLREQFDDADYRVELEVTYFRPPAPLLVVKFTLFEGDHIHPPVRARFNLEFGPEDIP